MSKGASEKPSSSVPGSRRARVSQSDVPRHSLAEAVRVAQAIEDHYGGNAVSPMDVAVSLGSTPSSSWFRTITGAAVAYGLTEGAYNSGQIKLTPRGQRLVAPTAEGQSEAALREALLEPRVMREFLTKYDRKKLPPDEIARNVISSLGVAKDAAERTLEAILDSARHVGVIRNFKGVEWVDLRGGERLESASVPGEAEASSSHEDVVEEHRPDEQVTQHLPPSVPKPIFIAHGKNKGPLQKLEKVLSSFKIPYRVAIREPNLGRPIPSKVKDIIRECGSAILIFTKDEEFRDLDGKEAWRPSENVVYELGAASLEYDDRVVVFMEKGLHFPANFDSIGRIEFEEDGIESKTMELMQELIGFGLLRVTPAS